MKNILSLSNLLLVPALIASAIAPSSGLSAEKAAPLSALGKMPVKEISVFKDGHVFVAHQGSMPTDADNNVLMDYLPTPIIGTFWPYSADKSARLTGVVASQRRVSVKRTALNVRELLEANVGADVYISEPGTNRYEATIVGFPTRSAAELEANSPPNSGEKLPEKGTVILLRTDAGVKALNIDRIQDVTFKQLPNPEAANEEFRNLLTLKLDWKGRPAKKAEVGLLYLQKGVRWIPSYKIILDGKGNAAVKLQATLINELSDLVDTSVNLVIGVPSFAFKETVDPMALQQTAAQLSQYFQNDSRSPLAANFGNAIMTQSARMGEYRQGGEPAAAAPAPELPEGAKNEDLFVFTLRHVTLKKGDRVALPVVEFTLPYKDVFTVDLPFAPPPEMRGNLNSSQQQELSHLFNAPKAMHKIRLVNTSKYPLTTAPALIIRDDQVLSQGMMTYTAPGANSDLGITTAVDITVKKSDAETERVVNAARHNGSSFSRVEMTGKITLTNHRGDPVALEITRHVLGNAADADHDGVVAKINVFESGEDSGSEYPYWWNWYGWPAWWSHFNGVSRISWKVNLETGKTIELGYRWHYFWN